ncbi:hypothetical protein J2741_000306 [Methanolinea mesophila]|uniref:PepSY domain-containing protein n=1 Tax=Methanolinea mesophila TaxID=547055 RepID=UPI001AE7B2F5|nr:PepSY domain-containing protein [Methanolinea mesophila]MBP1927759.1 hypothetical protein [Methanolinea mesophila]
MKQEKKLMKICILLILSLTLTAGYAQALPSIYNFGTQRSSTSYTFSISDLLSQGSFLIFGSYSWDFSKPDISSPTQLISKTEAIAIAQNRYPDLILTKPISARLWGNVWKVDIKGYLPICGASGICEYLNSGGILEIDAKTGEIIFMKSYM